MINETSCQHPSCENDSEETYTGPHGNALRLCERHYYNAVTDGAATTDRDMTPLFDRDITGVPDSNDNTDLPFWDPGIRCDDSTSNSVDWSFTPDKQLGYNDLARELMHRHRQNRRGL